MTTHVIAATTSGTHEPIEPVGELVALDDLDAASAIYRYTWLGGSGGCSEAVRALKAAGIVLARATPEARS